MTKASALITVGSDVHVTVDDNPASSPSAASLGAVLGLGSGNSRQDVPSGSHRRTHDAEDT
jgi:hypothetical protein